MSLISVAEKAIMTVQSSVPITMEAVPAVASAALVIPPLIPVVGAFAVGVLAVDVAESIYEEFQSIIENNAKTKNLLGELKEERKELKANLAKQEVAMKEMKEDLTNRMERMERQIADQNAILMSQMNALLLLMNQTAGAPQSPPSANESPSDPAH
ncbi:hypothetical protein BGX34_003538 [Mortierella sp. NVP85]|nr:hypothetical protein BGX34_003538 [Mortierella sp. NVP85]